MSKIEIYYFSGTGNSLHIAREIQKRIPDTTLIKKHRGRFESAGINRHEVGDERAPRGRISCTITTPSHARAVASLHVKR